MEVLQRNPRCQRCDLHTNAKNVCMNAESGAGAEIFLVGQWPQAEDEDANRPFVGDSGRKLMYLLGKAGLRRKDLHLTYLLKCDPKKETPKKKPHIDPCLPYLMHEIKTLKPKVIVTFGEKPTKAFLGAGIKFKEWVGFPVKKTFEFEDEDVETWIIACHSPASALNSWEQDEVIVRDLQVAQAYSEGKILYKMPVTPYRVIHDLDSLAQEVDKALMAKRLALDTETTGLSHYGDKIIDVGWYDGSGEAVIFPMIERYGEEIWEQDEKVFIAKQMLRLLESPNLKIGGQNFKFDLLFLTTFIIKTLKLPWDYPFFVRGIWDSQSMHHVLDENKPHNLTFLLRWYFYWDKYDDAMTPYKGTKRGEAPKKKPVDYSHAPNELRWQYLAHDVHGTHLLAELLEPQVYAEGLGEVYETEVGLNNYLLQPQLYGIGFNQQRTEELVEINQKRAKDALSYLRDIHTMLYGETKEVFNPNSQVQLAKMLKDAGADLKKRTPKGQASTGKNVLRFLSTQEDHTVKAIADQTQTLRNANKILSTYLNGHAIDCSTEDGEVKEQDKGFLPFMDKDHRIRPTYNFALTVTGRLSANDPPLQTVPRLHGLRSQIVPDNEDSVFLSCDYGKIELCVLAWCSNDEMMAKELINGVDLHAKTVIGVDLKRPPTDEEFERLLPQYTALPDWKQRRAVGKAVSFGVPYQITADGIVESNPDSFPNDMKKAERVELAQEMIDAYFARYPQVKIYLDGQFATVLRDGLLTTYFTQRKRRFYSAVEWLKSPWAKKTSKYEMDLQRISAQSCNFEIQSTASDELTRATRRVYEGLQDCKIPNFRIVFSLHDQLMFNVHKDYIEEATPLIRSWMETRFPQDAKHKYEIPFKVDVAVQRWWGDNEY